MKKIKKDQTDEIELRPDGWERFERAVDAAVVAGPKSRNVTRKAPLKSAPPRSGITSGGARKKSTHAI